MCACVCVLTGFDAEKALHDLIDALVMHGGVNTRTHTCVYTYVCMGGSMDGCRATLRKVFDLLSGMI